MARIFTLLLAIVLFCASPAVADNFSQLYESGLQARRAGDFPRAVEQLRAALKIAPDNPDAALFLGLSLNSLGRHEKAEELLRRFVDQYPDYAGLELALVRALMAGSRLQEARRRITALSARHPERMDIRAVEARLDLRSGQPERAERRYLALLDVEPGNRAALVGLIDTALALEQVDKAGERLDRLATAFPDDPAIEPRRDRLERLSRSRKPGSPTDGLWTAALGYRVGDLDPGLERHRVVADLARQTEQDIHRGRLEVESRGGNVNAIGEYFLTPWRSEIFVPTLRAGAGPGNDFLPKWRVGADLSARVRNSPGSLPMTVLDAGVLASGVGDGVTERFSLGARQWLDVGAGDLSLTLRGFLTNDENGGNLLGWLVQGDWRLAAGWAWRAGYGVGPEDSEGATIVIRTGFASVEAPVADRLSLIAAFSREDIDGVTARYFAGLTMKVRF